LVLYYTKVQRLRGGGDPRAIDHHRVDAFLILSIESHVVLQEAQQSLAPARGLKLQVQQAAIGQLEHRVELFQVDSDDGKLGREVMHNGRQGDAEAPSQR